MLRKKFCDIVFTVYRSCWQTGRGAGRVDAPPGRAGVRGHPTTGADDQHGVLPVEDKRGTDDEAAVAGRGEPQDDHHQVRKTHALNRTFYEILYKDFNPSGFMGVVLRVLSFFYKVHVWRMTE